MFIINGLLPLLTKLCIYKGRNCTHGHPEPLAGCTELLYSTNRKGGEKVMYFHAFEWGRLGSSGKRRGQV